jgi:hypothetical protein
MLRAIALLGLMLTSACATVTQGTTATIAVTSEPPGASCQIQREGGTVAVVNPTPGSVTISRSTRDLAVRCEREGSLPNVVAAPAGFQPMTLGNLLIGGVIGVAVDAASGAMGTYPGNVHVVLAPDQAMLLRRRDEQDAQRRREINAAADDRIAAARGECEARPRRTRGATSCDGQIDTINAGRNEQLRALDGQRFGLPQA